MSVIVQPIDRSGATNPGQIVCIADKAPVYQGQRKLNSQTAHVPDAPLNGYGKTGVVRSPPQETQTVAPETTLARSGDLGKGYSSAQIPPSASGPVFTKILFLRSSVVLRIFLRIVIFLRKILRIRIFYSQNW